MVLKKEGKSAFIRSRSGNQGKVSFLFCPKTFNSVTVLSIGLQAVAHLVSRSDLFFSATFSFSSHYLEIVI